MFASAGRKERARPSPARSWVPPLVGAVVVVAAGCGGRSAPARVALATPPLPKTILAGPGLTSTTIPLPQPIAIPDDPYAPEPVVRIGTMEIPKIGLVHPIYDGVTLHNIDLGPSHWPGSAMPGQPGNAVFAGHRVTHDHPFRHLDELVAGDEVIFTVNGTRTTYRVTGNLVVKPSDTWIADQTQAPTATLYACHPPGSAEYRYVVQMALATT
ncbi:MAG: sortase [Acidimicrobiales bacterium]